MSKQEKIRKNFSIKTINEVYEEQGRCCNKCGRSLLEGFRVDHKDGDCSNIEKDNCQLLCARCHEGRQWETLQQQKKATIGELTALIQKAIEGNIAGALMDKTLEAIKLKLSLEKQVADLTLMEAPATSRIEYSEAIAEYNLKEWLRGIREGFVMGVEWTSGKQEEKGDTSKSKKKVE